MGGCILSTSNALKAEYLDFFRSTQLHEYPEPFVPQLADKLNYTDADLKRDAGSFYVPFMIDAMFSILLATDALLRQGVLMADIRGPALKRTMDGLRFEGVSGMVSFNENGDRLGLFEIQNARANGEMRSVGKWSDQHGLEWESPPNQPIYPGGGDEPIPMLRALCPPGQRRIGPTSCEFCPEGMSSDSLETCVLGLPGD